MIRMSRLFDRAWFARNCLVPAGLTLTLVLVPATVSQAQDATQPATTMGAPAGAPAVSGDLKKLVDNYWHYGKIARYDLAAAAGQQVVASNSDPAAVLAAFEKTSSDRKDNLDDWLIRFSGIDAMHEVTDQLTKLLNQGRYTRRSDPAFIKANIERLTTSERGYLNGIAALRDSGELAVPFLVDVMRDPTKTQSHAAARRALRDLGRYALNPLVAATEMQDYGTLATICVSLGDLGYDVAVPYLAKIASMTEIPTPARNAATDAIQRITGSSAKGSAADLFYGLAESFYYDRAAIIADPRNPSGYVWRWESAEKGLTKIDVPSPIFNELMAMRSCEYALKLGNSQSDALSLWLASNFKREVELPAGTKDGTREENQPDAHYYGVSSGAQYLNAALRRALRDHNSQVALQIILALQDIAGQNNAMADGAPLVSAMAYPDRIVRFESAFAIASALPQRAFEGNDRVVPLLAEAISQSGQQSVLVAAPTADAINAMAEGLKTAGYSVAGGTNADGVAASANQVPAVDVVLISDDLPAEDIEKLLASSSQNPKLAGAAKVVMVKTEASPYEARKQSDPMITTTQAKDVAGLKPAIDAALKKAGALPVDPEVATKYATRAGMYLNELAINHSPIFDLAGAAPALLNALNDPRPDIVKLAGGVLSHIEGKNAQEGLLAIAGDSKTADDVKISLYRSLATSAKFYGNALESGEVESLVKVVAEAQNLDVRSAAADAHGALNLPADQAKTLIVKQAKM